MTEGYAIVNEHQVALGESTCVGVYDDVSSTGMLNIVDLGQICLERSTSAASCVQVMGELASEYGYNDAAESLFVGDTSELYVFHILKDSTGSSAIWAAKLIDSSHVATVMNAFVLEDIDVSTDFASPNFLAEAAKLSSNSNINFKQTFSGANEATCKYTSGRRMWVVLDALQPSSEYDPTYDDYLSNDYPMSYQPDNKVNATVLTWLMRNTYENTQFDMSAVPKLAGGAVYSPSRWASTSEKTNNETVCWEVSCFRFAIPPPSSIT